MKKLKGENMNNLKKLGLTALAGSLALTTANAVDYSLSGDAYVSWSTQDSESSQAASGKVIATDMDLYFNASTELENGFTVSFYQAVNTNSTLSVSSSQVTLGMGSFGTLQINEVAGSRANAIDDVMPNAMQETWDRVSDTANQVNPSFFGSSTMNGSLDYRIPAVELAGATLNAAVTYDPNADENAANASTGNGITTNVSGVAYTASIDYAGLTIGGGVESIDNDQGQLKASGEENTTGYIKYAYGPISVGYQEAYQDSRNGTSTEGADNEAEFWAVAYTAGPMSFSYGESTYTTKGVSDTAATTEQELESIQASYTMGAMTIMASMSEGSNIGATAAGGKNYEETSVAVNFAF